MKTKNMKMRGQRNNNPLNIKYVPMTHWVGEVHDELLKFDKTFAEFTDMKYGIRAGIKLIKNYIRSGYNTIDKIISRWCPDRTQYVYQQNVGYHVKAVFPNVDRWTVIGRDDKAVIREMVKAMAVMESHYRISDEEFDEAWQLV